MSRREEVECTQCQGTGEQKGKLTEDGAPLACKKCQGRGFFSMKEAKVKPDVEVVPAAEPEFVEGSEAVLDALAPEAMAAHTLIVLYSAGVQFIKSPSVAHGTLLAINPADGKTRVIS